ncbi:MAG: hypothetical protein MJ188_06970 [Treponema sp.]|nr:hypothetical protein [Treponema sp.]
MKKQPLFLFSALFFLSFSLNAFSPLPYGYKELQLGLSLNDTKLELLKDPDFGYHGDRDVSLIPGGNQVLIETDAEYGHGSVFFTQCYFQFYNDKLYTIILNINPNKMDYYSMLQTLSKKYGEPNSLDPKKTVWKNEEVTMILEKPLSVKYIDNIISKEISNYNTIEKSGEEKVRQMFLDDF